MDKTERKRAAALLKQAAKQLPGGQAGLAAELEVSDGLVWQWCNGRRPIAAGHCPAIERLTGIRCDQLRPDLVWTRNEQGQVTGHHVPLRSVA